MDPISDPLLHTVLSSSLGALRVLELAHEIAAMYEDAASRPEGWSAKTLATHDDVSTMLFAMKAGCRIGMDPAGGGVDIRVVEGHLELHVGDAWDQLPYPVRHTEGACSFFALFDHTIDLPVGSMLALDAVPHDIEALDDSAFILDIRTGHGSKITMPTVG
jgi:hypothetical protein